MSLRRIGEMRPPLSLIVVFLSFSLLAACTTHKMVQSPGSHTSVTGSNLVAKAPIESGIGWGRRTRYVSLRETRPASRSKWNREKYDGPEENRFVSVSEEPRSTFSIDVDTAGYANVRRLIEERMDIPSDAVRVEEMVNYFDYDYPCPQGDIPFAVVGEVSSCPWKPQHKLVRVALQGKEVKKEEMGPTNLVFLVDVSGSMDSKNKLPLLKKSLSLLVDEMDPNDRLAIVTYAGAAGLALPSTPCSKSERIFQALDELSAGGSTAGGEGIQLAYRTARANYVRGGINRVILATDGDFNVGVSSDNELVDLIEKEAKSGVYLSVLGFGGGNLNDSMLEKISGRGNGNYVYIDTIREAQKVLVEQRAGSLVTIAKDVKLQVEFNPAKVQAYRLIGYENRALENRDFTDDKKDAGEIGSGHQVTAFYEIVPPGLEFEQTTLPKLRYQKVSPKPALTGSDELLTVNIRYKPPGSDRSSQVAYALKDSGNKFRNASPDFRFASAVAAFGMELKDSEHIGSIGKNQILAWAGPGTKRDPHGYRREFVELVRKARM